MSSNEPDGVDELKWTGLTGWTQLKLINSMNSNEPDDLDELFTILETENKI